MLLKLIKKVDEAKDTKSFFFISNEPFKWKTGQYVYLTLGKTTKQFTIASSPTEEFIQITTKIKESSEFKQKLNKLEIGYEVEARGPFGSFVFTNHQSLFTNHLFLAGGIGITPFRSMIKYIVDSNLNISTHLIYSNSDSDFVFKKELDNWQKENDFIKVHYHDSSISGHLDVQKLNHFISNHSISCFWIVGPPTFVNAMEDILEELKIPVDNIKTEKFIGY